MFSYDHREPWYAKLTFSWGKLLALIGASVFIVFLQAVIYSSIQSVKIEYSAICSPTYFPKEANSGHMQYLKVKCGEEEFMALNSVAVDYYRYNRLIPVHCVGSRGSFTKILYWSCDVPYNSKGK